MMNTEKIAVGLDIGTTKIVCAIGKLNEHAKIEILGVGQSKSTGVQDGVVVNIVLTEKAIKEAVEEAEEQSGLKVHSVVAGIAGKHIRSLQHSDYITRENPDKVIDNNDIDDLINQVYKLVMLPGEEIIHVLPQEFKVDSQSEIKEPIGMYGGRLEANFHVITAQITAANNILKCVSKANLDTTTLMLEPLASAEAVLGEEEKEAGVVLIDIGGGTTDIAIFYEGIIRHTAVIPFGGNAVTEDIREGCSVMKNTAEALKIKFGSALADENKEEEIISIQGLRGREPKEVSVKNLALVIQARMEEILEQVKYEIQSSGYEKKIRAGAGIVITGGGAQLKHITQLVEYVTGIDSRVGYPNEHLAKTNTDAIKSPMYSTSIGLVIKGLQDIELKNVKAPLPNALGKVAPKDDLATREVSQRGGFLNNIKNNIANVLMPNDDKDFL